MSKRTNTNEYDDDDEEILRQEAEFFKQKAQKQIIPAATVVKSSKDVQVPSLSKSIPNDAKKMDIDPAKENIQYQIANTFEAIPNDMKLNQIKEKRTSSNNIRSLKFDASGFPKAVRRDPNIKPEKGSIFSQHIKRLKKNTDNVAAKENKMDVSELSLVVKEMDSDGNVTSKDVEKDFSLDRIATAAQRSTILSSTDKQQLHNDNLKTLNHMSSEEILAEKERLLSTLDPVLVQFLRSRQSVNQEETETRNKTIKEQNMAAANVNLEELEAPRELLSIPESTGWINFNKFEATKLAWMQDVSLPDLTQTEGFEARFDFEGYLLPHQVEIDENNRVLFHHGVEPERPGYSIQEILSFSRSTVIQQRIIALNTLGNLLSLDQTGIYEDIMNLPIEQIFFVLRVCLDENTRTVLTAAIKALRNLVYFQIDETCLDNMMSFGIGFVQPILAVDNAMEDDYTINDQQLAETNLIKCLARTEILIRIRYIVNTIKPPIGTIIYCIEILIRLARDSDFIINKILECEGLLSNLIKYFLPLPQNMGSDKSVADYFMPLPQMVKLLRVLSSRSKTIAEDLLNKYDLLNNMILYLQDDYFSQNSFGMHLQVESMYYWTVILHYGLSIESLRENETLISKLLDYHFKNTDNVMSTTLIRQSHVAALFMVLAKAVEHEHIFNPIMTIDCFEKWISQFKSCEVFKCGHSQITSSILYYVAVSFKNDLNIYNADLFETILNSVGFKEATSTILNGSLLLNNFETHNTTNNLKSLQAAAWFCMDHIVPVLQTNSCIPLLYAFSSCILNLDSPRLKVKFLNHPNIINYTETLKLARDYFNVNNWFTRCESFLIMNILKIVESVRDEIDPTLYYDIAVKYLCVFSVEQKQDMEFLMNKIVFCPRFYPVEVAMANISVRYRNDELDLAWKSLDEIKEVYMEVLGLKSNLITFDSTLSLDMSIGNVIPIDWIFTPLILLYTNSQNRPADEVHNEWEDFRIIINCLRWVLIYETYFEVLAKAISPAEKYVRLSCLFLANDNLFLHIDLQDLITLVYEFLVKDEININFRQEISGLTNFKDFYGKLLEQYQAVSYGNKVFANVLLFPLVKRHDVKYRKLLWSEYVEVLETIKLSPDEVWLAPEYLISPADQDISLCTWYYKAWISNAVEPGTILHAIAQRSLEYFKRRLDRQRRAGRSNGFHVPLDE